MDVAAALDYLRSHRQGVLTTQKREGRPQLSNIAYWVDDHAVRISVTAGRAKAANLARDTRVSLHVTAADFWSYVVVEGDATLSAVAVAPDDATVELLIAYYRALRGEHPDWDEYRQAMVADGRQVITFIPTHAYGMLP